jgi:DNA helicase-2/ATP-dependent DNA helicase PcrA
MAQVAADVFSALGPALKAANAMDFDDLLLHPLTLFREQPDRLAYYRERFSFVLVDEFQDTNRAQYELIRLIGAHGNVCAVGDDDQSIYGWRGADVRNMREFARDFPGTQLVRLEENYRSTQMVLDAANSVISENAARIGKTLHTRRQGGEALTVLAAADERDEAEWIVRELERRRAAADWSLEEAFRKAGMPYRLIGATSFYERREVKDLLAYLRLVANRADDEAFLRAVGVPKRGLGDTSIALLLAASERWTRPLLDTARLADGISELRPNAREAFRAFAAFIARLHEAAETWTPAQLLEEIIRGIDYEASLLAEGPDGADRWDNVRELVASAADWSEVVEGDEEGTPLERFLAEAALVSANDKVSGDDHGVTMMTLHTAKGLEWPVVVLAGLEDGLFPLARAAEQPDGVEEERRLCYVGLTRAKDKLYVTWARARRRGGELRPGAPSRFLRAIPPAITEEKRTTSLWAPDWGAGRIGSGPRRRDAATPSRWGTSAPATVRREPDPQVEEASQDAPRYVKGERVRHRRFGAGTITGLSGVGRDTKVSVAFDDADIGVKQLLVAYAGLERDWEGA